MRPYSWNRLLRVPFSDSHVLSTERDEEEFVDGSQIVFDACKLAPAIALVFLFIAFIGLGLHAENCKQNLVIVSAVMQSRR